MGDWYEIKELAGEVYLEYQSEKSGWTPKAKKLTAEEFQLIDDFMDQLEAKKRDFLRHLVD